jgi:hypothetical protein
MSNQVGQKVTGTNQDWIASDKKTGESFNCVMENKIRGCKCKPEYRETKRWTDGRIRITKSDVCSVRHIILWPDGIYRIHDGGIPQVKDLAFFEEVNESDAKKLHKAIVEEMKEQKKGCIVEWNGKIYSFGGLY